MTQTLSPALSVSDVRFAELKARLRELFELDKSDLDFGIYRIMAAKNKEVTDFLDRQLKEVVRETIAQHADSAADQVREQLDEAIKQAQALGADPDSLPRVKQLKAQLAAAGGSSATEIEADIYNHLLAFFSRYYDEGDFISRRRYKGDTYAIPYSGEEVVLHWANKDQYYIKSGEWHKDYRFKAGESFSVRFKLVQATQETGNNKEADNAKRRYILAADHPVEVSPAELTLRFEFRVPSEKEKQEVVESTRIFGGKFDAASARTKGDEREQFCADAEQRALATLPQAWKKLIAAPGSAATDTKPLRTLLGKHLDQFTARNTFDYFIHKDLGGFLRRELDFYIKNEVVRLDDLETLAEDHLARVQGKVKAIRRVASRVIDFLASVEEFQKKLWLKKKLVLNTQWLVTIDRIPAKLRDVVAANPQQWQEWESLGFKPAETDKQGLFNGVAWGTREYLDANDKLVVDTRFFDEGFKSELLASDEVTAGLGIAQAKNAVLISSDNFQAVKLLQSRYCHAIKCVYIDPPYNTGADGFPYKDHFRHSSWTAFILDRLVNLRHVMRRDGAFYASIDDREIQNLRWAADNAFGCDLFVSSVAVINNWKGRQDRQHIATAHEYLLLYAMPEFDSFGFRLNDAQIADYDLTDTDGARYQLRDLRKRGGSDTREARPNLYYPIYWNEELRRASLVRRTTDDHEIYPLKSDGSEGCWRWKAETVEHNIEMIEATFNSTKWSVGYRVYLESEGEERTSKPKSVWAGSKYSSDHGIKTLKQLIPTTTFKSPKAIGFLQDVVSNSTCDDEVILDAFAGSGTTGHAVVTANRGDQGERKIILIDQSEEFHTVLKPRIVKVLYSPDWKDGKAQTHGKGMSALVKYFALESYEDALNNLPAPTGELLAQADPQTRDGLITYSLDLELGPSLLNLDAFRDPWNYRINAQPAGEEEIRPHRVDLVETFNYLIGLKVKAYGPIRRYAAEFARADHPDSLGRLKLTANMQLDSEAGPFVFQQVEGETLDGARVLVIWRKLTDNPEQDAAVLDAWMAKHRENTKERSEHREYQRIYINGPVTLEQPTADLTTVFPLEQEFKNRMFE